ncbi:MAG: hypothetical protein Kow001_25370 [Acidobacteriota bacterium]
MLAAAAAGWWFFLDSPSDPLEVVPAGVQGVLVVRDPPPSLEFLADTRAAQWLDLDRDELRRVLDQGPDLTSLGELGSMAASATLILHDLTPRSEGRYRVEFSAVLVPRFPAWLHRDGLREWITARTVARFQGQGQVIVEEGPETVIRGAQPGQELYLGDWSGWVLVSNSEQSHRLMLQAAAGQEPRLVDSPTWQYCRPKVFPDPDILLYFRGGDRFGLIPEFVWAVALDGAGVQESYCEPR